MTPTRPPRSMTHYRAVTLVIDVMLLLFAAGLQLWRTQGGFGPNWLVFDLLGLCCVVVCAGSVGFLVGHWVAARLGGRA